MRFKYTPDGPESTQEWSVELGRLRTFETEAIERVSGLNYDTDFRARLLSGNVRARRALLWVLLRRTHPGIRFDDVDFAADDVVIEFTADEWAKMLADIESAPAPSEEARDEARTVIAAELARARAEEEAAAAAADAAGKADPLPQAGPPEPSAP